MEPSPKLHKLRVSSSGAIKMSLWRLVIPLWAVFVLNMFNRTLNRSKTLVYVSQKFDHGRQLISHENQKGSKTDIGSKPPGLKSISGLGITWIVFDAPTFPGGFVMDSFKSQGKAVIWWQAVAWWWWSCWWWRWRLVISVCVFVKYPYLCRYYFVTIGIIVTNSTWTLGLWRESTVGHALH
jgi:hypothetical protein